MDDDFITWFHTITPYIHAHRGKTLVIACPGEAFIDDQFRKLAYDINLLASLGIRIVLVHGARPQIEAQLKAAGIKTMYHRGIRITQASAISSVKRAVGELRIDIEARLSIGLTDTRKQNAALCVAGGNYLTARPLGVVDGIDYEYAGKVRKVDTEAIKHALDNSHVVLASPLGYSPSGEVFNLHYEEAAARIATSLHAEKLIYLLTDAALKPLPPEGEYMVTELEALINQVRNEPPAPEIVPILTNATDACRHHVNRVHLIPLEKRGSLLLELFTHKGIGIMVTNDPAEIVRDASIEDIAGILRIIEPLEQQGALVRRDRQKLEQEIDQYLVLEHDHTLLGCVALYPCPDKQDTAEMACFAVHPDHHHDGYGDRLFSGVIERCKKLGISKLFVLTTQTAHWFIEHGFIPATIDVLPDSKREHYNWKRKSKVFVYSIENQ